MNRTLKYEMKRKRIESDSKAILWLLGEIWTNTNQILIYLDRHEKERLESLKTDEPFNNQCHQTIREVFEIGCE